MTQKLSLIDRFPSFLFIYFALHFQMWFYSNHTWSLTNHLLVWWVYRNFMGLKSFIQPNTYWNYMLTHHLIGIRRITIKRHKVLSPIACGYDWHCWASNCHPPCMGDTPPYTDSKDHIKWHNDLSPITCGYDMTLMGLELSSNSPLSPNLSSSTNLFWWIGLLRNSIGEYMIFWTNCDPKT